MLKCENCIYWCFIPDSPEIKDCQWIPEDDEGIRPCDYNSYCKEEETE